MPQKTNIEWTDYTTNPKEDELSELVRSMAISGKRVLVCDMCDLFHLDVESDMIDSLFAVFALRPDVTFQVLTKRINRADLYLSDPSLPKRVTDRSVEIQTNTTRFMNQCGTDGWWPLKNVWIGTSVENQKMAERRIPALNRCDAAVRFLSCEPLLGEIDFKKIKPSNAKIHWVIVGGESGHNARPCDVNWIRSMIQQCDLAGVPCFVNQLGGKRDKRSDPSKWTEDLRVRRFPS